MPDYNRIVGALLSGGWQTLYHNDAGFHQSIDMLARMLPMWVAGMAEGATQSATVRAEQLAALTGYTNTAATSGIEVAFPWPNRGLSDPSTERP